jgi:hypothetical protein
MIIVIAHIDILVGVYTILQGELLAELVLRELPETAGLSIDAGDEVGEGLGFLVGDGEGS